MRGIFFTFTVLMLTACTGKNDMVLENGMPEHEAEEMPGAEGASGMEGEPEAANTDGGAEQKPGGEAVSEENRSVETASQDIYVHICGAVAKPGVYVLRAGSRVYEGVEAAGGFAEDACEDFVNQAGLLTDGQRLVIPTMEEAEAARADGSYQEVWRTEAQGETGSLAEAETAGGTGSGVGNSGGLVNINTAAENELSAIPGIGAGKAAAIVKYRQENGAFTSIEDIMKVSGIKEGTFEKIKDKITVN